MSFGFIVHAYLRLRREMASRLSNEADVGNSDKRKLKPGNLAFELLPDRRRLSVCLVRHEYGLVDEQYTISIVK